MAIKITAVVLGIAALLMTFRGEWLMKKFMKISEPSQKQILSVKFAELGIAVIAFAMVFRVGN